MPLSTNDWIDYLNIHSLSDNKQKIIKFIFLWMKYNEWYSKYGLGDTEGSQKLSDINEARCIYEEIKNEFLYGGRIISRGFNDIPIESRPNEIRKGLYRDNGNLLCAYNSEVNCFCKYLKVIYKIRCNFFHGDKLPSETNILLIKWAYESLNMLLSKLKEHGIIEINL